MKFNNKLDGLGEARQGEVRSGAARINKKRERYYDI